MSNITSNRSMSNTLLTYWCDRWNSCAEIIFLLVNTKIGTIQTIPATTCLQRSIMFKIELWSIENFHNIKDRVFLALVLRVRRNSKGK